MNDMNMSKEKIDYTVRVISKRLPMIMKNDVRKAILYGSCARGDYDSDSDIDIAVLTNCGREEAKKYSAALTGLATDIAMDTFAVVDFSCIPYDEYEKKSSWYMYFNNIKKDGVSIYG